MKRIPSVAPGRHLFVIAGLALASTVGNLLAVVTDTYYVSDHLATTTAVADAAGEIASLEADAFGSPVSGGEQADRYTGKPYDADIGAYVFPFRNYRSDEARWMSADPSGFPDGINSSCYGLNPNSGVDPLGLASVTITSEEKNLADIFQAHGAAAYYQQSVGAPASFNFSYSGTEASGFSAKITGAITFSPGGHLVKPKLDSSYGGATVTASVLADLLKHESLHRDHFNIFTDKVITVAETWATGYSSNLFMTSQGAQDALKADINNVFSVVNSMFSAYLQYAEGNGHPGATVSNGVWTIPDPTKWGDTVTKYVSGLNPSSQFKKTQGNFHRE